MQLLDKKRTELQNKGARLLSAIEKFEQLSSSYIFQLEMYVKEICLIDKLRGNSWYEFNI